MSAFDGLKELFFPRICLYCKEVKAEDGGLRKACRRTYETEKYAPCRRCGKQNCRCQCKPVQASPDIFAYLSVFPYRENSPGGRLILTVKDRKHKGATELLGGDMAKSLYNGCILRADAVVTYAPRSRGAIAESGTDQAKELAKVVAKVCSLPFVSALKRKRGGVQKELNAKERAAHAAKSYALAKKCPDLTGKQVILVDDIVTTGASLAACASLLKEKGAAQIVCLTAGKTVRARKETE